MKDDYDKKAQVVTVTVLYAPSVWLLSLDQVMEIPVRCVLSNLNQEVRIDLATPLTPLPEDLLRPNVEKEGINLRRAFRIALRSAVGKHLGREVGTLMNDRIEWEEGAGDVRS